jgi:hypothetical protein
MLTARGQSHVHESSNAIAFRRTAPPGVRQESWPSFAARESLPALKVLFVFVGNREQSHMDCGKSKKTVQRSESVEVPPTALASIGRWWKEIHSRISFHRKWRVFLSSASASRTVTVSMERIVRGSLVCL